MDQRDPNTVAMDAGTPPPTTPTPIVPVATATTPNQTPQADSNQPDTDTQAGASIPANLVNNPQVPSQKLASQADNNKTSVAPDHKWLHDAAVEMAGGPQYRTTYDANGNAIRTEVPVSPAHLGLQSITDCKALLTMYESLRSQQGVPKVTTPHGESKELVKVKINTVPGKEWVTRDIPSAAILSMRGYELLRIELNFGNKAGFWFAYDDSLKDILAKFNKGELLVQPRAWNEVQFQLRERLRKEQSK